MTYEPPNNPWREHAAMEAKDWLNDNGWSVVMDLLSEDWFVTATRGNKSITLKGRTLSEALIEVGIQARISDS